jgi:hypothetical protein
MRFGNMRLRNGFFALWPLKIFFTQDVLGFTSGLRLTRRLKLTGGLRLTGCLTVLWLTRGLTRYEVVFFRHL